MFLLRLTRRMTKVKARKFFPLLFKIYLSRTYGELLLVDGKELSKLIFISTFLAIELSTRAQESQSQLETTNKKKTASASMWLLFNF